MDSLTPDAFGRTPIADAVKASIAQAFTALEPGKRGALLVLADERGGVRAHLAARLGGGDWKVAAGAGWKWGGSRPTGSVAIAGSW